MMGHYVYAGLDSDEFMVMTQVSPYVSRRFGERLFVRGAYGYTDKGWRNGGAVGKWLQLFEQLGSKVKV